MILMYTAVFEWFLKKIMWTIYLIMGCICSSVDTRRCIFTATRFVHYYTPFWIKFLWFFPKLGISMDRKNGKRQFGFLRNFYPINVHFIQIWPVNSSNKISFFEFFFQYLDYRKSLHSYIQVYIQEIMVLQTLLPEGTNVKSHKRPYLSTLTSVYCRM